MRSSRLLSAALLAAVCTAPALRAQTTSQDDAERAARSRLKSDLRNLVTAQESYYADHSASIPLR